MIALQLQYNNTTITIIFILQAIVLIVSLQCSAIYILNSKIDEDTNNKETTHLLITKNHILDDYNSNNTETTKSRKTTRTKSTIKTVV
mmetsp:Transcript_12993/g.14482  ORF Transcript_12993/g.14482 Transcript_12993/m.14482 type:complete len:88 (+) Transcript_12993:488-751(+)